MSLGSIEIVEVIEGMPVFTEPQIRSILVVKCLPAFKGNITHTALVIETDPPTAIQRFGRKNGQLGTAEIAKIIEHYENKYRKIQDPAFPGKAVVEYRMPWIKKVKFLHDHT